MGKIQEALQKIRTDEPPSAPLSRRRPQVGQRAQRTSEVSILASESLTIDWQKLVDHGLLPEASATSRISQQFRSVKRPLLRQIFQSYPIGPEEIGRILLITSAIKGEGKSFATLNLAFAIAIEPELQVLLIDGDPARHTLTTGFGLEGRRGLLDLAADESISTESCIYETSQDRVYFMPAGKKRGNSPELLGSSRARKLLAEVAQNSGPCVIIIDSSPLLVANEARALAAAADHALFVVRFGETNAQLVESALETLGGTENIFMLLNQSASEKSAGYLDGYGYGHDNSVDPGG